MPQYTITEPHPTVAQNSYTHAGRGGAGNMFRAPLTTAPTGVPTKAKASSSSTGRFYSGRGGAGNAHTAAERVTLSLDEEFSRADVRAKSVTASSGRGGAGNIYTTGGAKKDRKNSSGSDHSMASSRRDSTSTNGSARSGFWARLSTSSRA